MADDYNNYRFESQSEADRDFVLANGDVISVLNSGRTVRTTTARKSPSYHWNTASRIRSGNSEFTFARPRGNASFASGGGPDLSARAAGAPFRFPVQSVGAPTSYSINAGSPLAAGDIGTFSSFATRGLTANAAQSGTAARGGDASPAPESFRLNAGNGLPGAAANQADVPAPARGSFAPVQEENAAASAGRDPEAGVSRVSKRTLVFSASDVANFKSYQVGGETSTSSADLQYTAVGKSNGYAYASVDSGYHLAVEPDGPVYDVVISDPEAGSGSGGGRTNWGWCPVIDPGWITIQPVEPRPWIGIVYPEYPFIWGGGDFIEEDYTIELTEGWIDYEESDFSKIELEYASKLSFSVSTTNAASFTVYQCVDDGETCTMKALQTTQLVWDAESETYIATTKGLLLEAGDYCISVQSEGTAPDGVTPSYSVSINGEDTEYFTEGDNSDDWTDLKTAGELGEVADIGVLDEGSFDLLYGWVGFGDSIDYAGFTLDSTAKLSFSIDSTDAIKFTVYRLVKDGNSYSLKSVFSASPSWDKEWEEYETTTKALLLESGTYYISVQSTNAGQGGSADYNIYINDEDTAFFTEGDNSDDWTDLKTEGEFGQVGNIGYVDENSFDILSGWVGCGDSVDYAGFTLGASAKVSFMLDATDAAKFTIYQLIRESNGTYSLKSLQSTTLSWDKDFEDYEAKTKALLLEAGDYYISVQSTNASQGGSADYNVYLNDEDTVFFTEGDTGDDWTDLKTEGEFGHVGWAGSVDENSFDILSGWVGFGDSIDYAGFTLGSSAKLSFSIDATDAAKFTIYQLVQDKNGKYSLKSLQSTTLSWDRDFEDYEATTKSLMLGAGDYYISVQSTNASQGGDAYYNVCLNYENTEFFPEDDDSDCWDDLETLGPDGSVGDLGYVNEYTEVLTEGWAGLTADYAKICLDYAGKVSFSIDATDAAEFTVYRLVRDKKGKYSLSEIQSTSLAIDKLTQQYDAKTKALLLEAGDYYISMQATNAAKSGGASYVISLNAEDSVFYTEGNAWDDWTDVKTAGAYGEVGFAGWIDPDADGTEPLLTDWVGFGDSIDYSGFSICAAGKVSFTLDATDAATFTIYRLIENRNGTFALSTLQTTALAWDGKLQKYVATTNGLLLEAGDYYFSMQSTNASQGGSAYYNVNVNLPECAFYADGFNGDDWTDVAVAGGSGEVGYVGAVDADCTEPILTDWVGFGDAVDYAGFYLFSAGKISFALDATDAATFTVYQLVENRNGSFSLKTLQTTALAWDGNLQKYVATTKGLLLEEGEYFFSMQSTNAGQGGSAYYNVNLNTPESVFYTESWNCDDWTDLKTAGAYGEAGDVGYLDEYTSELVRDWVGFGDAVDYMKFSFFGAMKTSFSVEATDAAMFTIYELVENRNGSFSLNALQTTALAWDKQLGKYVATTKGLLLEEGEYYFSMQSTNASQGGNAYYSIDLNMPECAFYTECGNWDDWTDMKENGEYGEVGDVGVLDASCSELVADEWVGFGDAVDYMRFTLWGDSTLSFALDADGATEFTVWQLVENKNGTYSLKSLQTTGLALDKQTGGYAAVTKALQLEAGDYYFSMQSTDASQGGSAHYNIGLNQDACNFPENDGSRTGITDGGHCVSVGEIYYVETMPRIIRAYSACEGIAACEPVTNDFIAVEPEIVTCEICTGADILAASDDKQLGTWQENATLA